MQLFNLQQFAKTCNAADQHWCTNSSSSTIQATSSTAAKCSQPMSGDFGWGWGMLGEHKLPNSSFLTTLVFFVFPTAGKAWNQLVTQPGSATPVQSHIHFRVTGCKGDLVFTLRLQSFGVGWLATNAYLFRPPFAPATHLQNSRTLFRGVPPPPLHRRAQPHLTLTCSGSGSESGHRCVLTPHLQLLLIMLA